MPQIWLTYREFASLIDCDPVEARQSAIAAGLDRRKSRDGQTRVKLTPQLVAAFLDDLVQRLLEQQMTACASDLRATHELMQRQNLVTPAAPLRTTPARPADGKTGIA